MNCPHQLILLVLLTLNSGTGFGQTFSLEEKFAPILEPAIQKRAGEIGNCVAIGQVIKLGTDGTSTGWIVTTQGACGWAASAGPIMVFIQSDSGPKLVLEDMAISFTIGKQGQNGWRHIATARSTAGAYEEKLWKFDGARYTNAKFRYVDLKDAADCKRNRDVCKP